MNKNNKIILKKLKNLRLIILISIKLSLAKILKFKKLRFDRFILIN